MSTREVNTQPSPPVNKPSEEEIKHKRKIDIIIAVVILVVGLIVVGFLVILALRERALFNACNDNESPYCYQFACEQLGDRCGGNAIRWSEDEEYYACSDAPSSWFDKSGNQV